MDSKKRFNEVFSKPFSSVAIENEISKSFFQKLKFILKEDLAYLKLNSVNTFCLEFFNACEISEGALTQKKDTPCEYLFFTVPKKQGLLIQHVPDEKCIQIFNATQRTTMKKNPWGGMEKDSLIVLKSKILEEFKPLDENYVRTNDELTLSVEQASEFLLTFVTKNL